MIPKIIHQLWIGPKTPPTEWMNTWKEKNPDWEYILWDEHSLEQLQIENQSIVNKILETPYMGKIEYHGIKDVFQYEILYRYGGMFIDADSICKRPLPDYLTRFDCFTCYEAEEIRKGYTALGYVGSSKGFHVFRDIIDELKSMSNYFPAWKAVGQLLWTKHCEKNKDIVVLPSTLFIPKHYTNHINGDSSCSIAEQFWGTTLSGYK